MTPDSSKLYKQCGILKAAGPVARNSRILSARRRKRMSAPRVTSGGGLSLRDEFPEVYDFYHDIAPYIRMRELGVDKLPEDEDRAFKEILDVPIVYNDSEYSGYYAPWRELGRNSLSQYNPLRYLLPRDHVALSRGGFSDRRSTAVHEYRHALERRIGLSGEAKKALNDVYGFRGVNIMGKSAPSWFGWLYSKVLGDEEAATTNAQHQFLEYMKLRSKMESAGKGKPTGKDYLAHIDNIDKYRARDNRAYSVNAYQDSADGAMNDKKRSDNWKIMSTIPSSMEYEGGTALPSWIDLAPHTRESFKKVRKGEKTIFNPRALEIDNRDEEEAGMIKKVLGGISLLNAAPKDKAAAGGAALSKSAQMKSYTERGGLAGALAGGSLAAILSAAHYWGKKGKEKKKQSNVGKVLKSILWTALGAAGGGIAGAGIGRMIATHIKYRRALAEAKEKVKERRRLLGIPENGRKNGRVMYVNYPENRFELDGAYKKLFGKSVPIQHAGLLVMNEDGSDAALYSPLMNQDPDDVRRIGTRLVNQGKSEKDPALLEEGNNLISGKIDRGTYDIYYFNNLLKGKNDKEIARFLADRGKANDLGGEVHVYEGAKGVDRDLVEAFMECAQRIAHVGGNPGYSIFPGGYNCGTASREGFDVVQGPGSHWRDMLLGGWPSFNAPSFTKETVARYFKDEGRNESAAHYGWSRSGRE